VRREEGREGHDQSTGMERQREEEKLKGWGEPLFRPRWGNPEEVTEGAEGTEVMAAREGGWLGCMLLLRSLILSVSVVPVSEV
jgi:hypothetical protein